MGIQIDALKNPIQNDASLSELVTNALLPNPVLPNTLAAKIGNIA
jgi:hypothetical protein